MSKNLDEQVDKLEAAVDPNTVISIGGYNFTPAKLMIAGGILSSLLGGLWGAFEIYKDYMNMKEAIQTYVAPDLSAINEKLSVLEKQMDATKSSVAESTNFTNEIKNDLKGDVRRIENMFENLERSNKQSIRDTDNSVKEVKREVDSTLKEVRRYSDQTIKELNQEMTRNQKETQQEIRALRKEIDDKIKKALDNPLSN